MKTLRRLLYREVLIAVGLVTLGFLALFFFFDFVEELQTVNRIGALGYRVPQALIFITLMLPNHLYELLPITVLIGTIFLTVCLIRLMRGDFTPKQHFGFEAAAWYWHFVDVVWLFLFAFIYVIFGK